MGDVIDAAWRPTPGRLYWRRRVVDGLAESTVLLFCGGHTAHGVRAREIAGGEFLDCAVGMRDVTGTGAIVERWDASESPPAPVDNSAPSAGEQTYAAACGGNPHCVAWADLSPMQRAAWAITEALPNGPYPTTGLCRGGHVGIVRMQDEPDRVTGIYEDHDAALSAAADMFISLWWGWCGPPC